MICHLGQSKDYGKLKANKEAGSKVEEKKTYRERKERRETRSCRSRDVITLFRIMLIGPYYEFDYVSDMILCANYVNICDFEFLSVHRKNICWNICFGN